MAARKLPTSEFAECCAFVDWCALVRYRGEALAERVVKIPNERNAKTAQIMALWRIGVRAGFPDYAVLAPEAGYAGLFIEAKRPGGKIAAAQHEWRARLAAWGYRAEIADDGAHMIAIARAYFAHLAEPDWIDRTRLPGDG